ncbi:helix-turn-helix domain-containing protein [Arachnia rubra]|uniref:Helix-turn-helix domain-containing protein n=1 Tax=Arachnia rubra TaxID=1547448 RepID=A0ABX7Y2K1_9ACTN|nr:helix-turn-helix domain-containing protein [Arachnia rubra]
MSIWAVNWAFQLDVPNQTHKLVLLSLANFADDEDEAWPHVETLAKMASVSVRSVFRALAALEAAGLISRTMGLRENAGGGLRKSNSLYRLHVPDEVSRRAGRGEGRPKLLREAPSGSQPDTGVMLAAVADKTPSGSQCDTGVTLADQHDTGGTTNMTPVSGLYKENPSHIEPPTPLPPTPPAAAVVLADGSGGVGSGSESDSDVEDSRGGVGLPAAGSAPAGGRAVSPNADGGVVPVGRDVAADWVLIRHALPEPMQVLDDDGVAVVAPLLRERLDAGWTAADLRAHLAVNPIPARVRHLAGLVAHRLSKLPPEGAPKSSPSKRRVPDPPSMPPLRPEERHPVAVRAEEARAEAIRTGSPDAGRSRVWWLMREMEAASKAAEGMSGV